MLKGNVMSSLVVLGVVIHRDALCTIDGTSELATIMNPEWI